MDLRRETDIEHLRRVALAQQIQIAPLLRVLQSKCEELESLKGNPEELQQTLALIETLTKQKTAAAEAPASGPKKKADRKKREKFGSTEQPKLPHVETVFELDMADRTCLSCGGALEPMAGQFEDSELIDFVEISYRIVKAKQQKYVCRCGGCVETAPGPERVIRGGRYSLSLAIKIALDKYLDHIPLARQERISEIYDIDDKAGADLDKRVDLRRTESKEVLAKLKTWLWSQAVLKTLSIGKAAAYVIANWDRLIRFADNPLIPLDNNGTERGIRGPVVGRKNHYGSKSRRGTEVAAIFYTLVETTKLHDADPAKYLLEAVRAADPWQMLAAD